MNITAEKVNSSSSTHASPRQSASTSDTNSNLDQINQEESDSVIDSTSYVFGDELGSKVKKPVILVGGRISSESVFGNESVFGDDPTISNTTTTAPEKDGAYASGGRGDSLSSVFAEEWSFLLEFWIYFPARLHTYYYVSQASESWNSCTFFVFRSHE